jgi:dTDP-glucose 4,6-dehydratase
VKRLLIVGGGGFIGLHYLEHVLSLRASTDPDFNINVIDKLTYSSNKNQLQELKKTYDFEFSCVDINDNIELSQAFNFPDYVINFAAESHVDNSILRPRIFAETNFLGVANLLELAKDRNVSRFMQISTDEVYGSLVDGEATEFTHLSPSSPYSSSKAAADLLVQAFHTTYGLNTVISRTCNNFGPGQHTEKLIPRAIKLIGQNKPVPVYGSGQNVREWIDVRDNVQAIHRLLLEGKNGEIYNIGSGFRISNLDLLSELIRFAGHGEIEFVEDRLGHDERYALDSTKLKELFEFQPSRTLSDFFSDVFPGGNEN